MSDEVVDKIIIEIQRVSVKPGEHLYVRIPEGLQEAQMHRVADVIHRFFESKNVHVLSGIHKLEFTAVAHDKGFN